MVATKINDGGVIVALATTARTSGDVIVIGGDTIGIAGDTVANGALLLIHVNGTFELAKNTTVNLTAGEDVYWTNDQLTTVKTNATRIGVAALAGSTTASRGRVLLNHPNVQLVPQT
jgi:predicted RecA/RadA family phage recombinase